MKRRAVLPFAGAILASPGWVLAQAPRQFRIGYLSIVDEGSTKPFADALLTKLRDHGYVIGRNVALEMRYARGDYSRLPSLAEELIALNPDVLIGIETSAQVMRSRTTTIPIVLPASTDPVAAGLAQSLARPGTNVTGRTIDRSRSDDAACGSA
jgi:putative ABC transport system substrate-binding protein